MPKESLNALTSNFGDERTAFDMLVTKLNGNLVFSGRGRQIRYRYRAVLVVVTTYFGLAGPFDSQ